MKRLLVIIGGALCGVAVLSTPAAAAATICYDAAVVVNGDAVVDEAGCHSVG